MRRALAAVTCAATLLALAGPAEADRARALRARAEARYRAGEYRAAAALLLRSYRARPRPATLFAWADAEHRAGNCAVARPLYEHYLANYPRGRDRDDATRGRDQCAAGLPPNVHERVVDSTKEAWSAGASGVAPAPGEQREQAARLDQALGGGAAATGAAVDVGAMPVAAPAAPVSLPSASPARARPTDYLAGGLMIGGAIVATAGGALALSSPDELPDDATHDLVTQAQDARRRRRIAGGVTAAVGVTAIAAGAIRWLRRSDDDEAGARRSLVLDGYVGHDRAGLFVRGSF